MINQTQVIDLFERVGNAAATHFSQALGSAVSVSDTAMRIVSRTEVAAQDPGSLCIACIPVTTPRPGAFLFVFAPPLDTMLPELFINRDAAAVPPEFTELHRGAFSELFSILWGEAVPVFSEFLKTKIQYEQPVIEHMPLGAFMDGLPLFTGIDSLVMVTHHVALPDSGYEGPMLQIMPAAFLRDLLQAGVAPSPPAPKGGGIQAMPVTHVTPPAAPAAPASAGDAPEAQVPEGRSSQSNLETLKHIAMQVVVELGGATMNMEDILSLQPGRIVEMDDDAGAPVGILVNGKLIARGQVVTIGEKFGVTVTQLVAPEERLLLKT